MHPELTAFARALAPELTSDFRVLIAGDVDASHRAALDRGRITGLAGPGLSRWLGFSGDFPCVFVHDRELARIASRRRESPAWHARRTTVHELAHHLQDTPDIRASVAAIELGGMLAADPAAEAAAHDSGWILLSLALAHRAYSLGVFLSPDRVLARPDGTRYAHIPDPFAEWYRCRAKILEGCGKPISALAAKAPAQETRQLRGLPMLRGLGHEDGDAEQMSLATFDKVYGLVPAKPKQSRPADADESHVWFPFPAFAPWWSRIVPGLF
jgi:hypothetical protein